MNETETRAKPIDPALHARGWDEDLIRREATAGRITIHGDSARQSRKGRADYVLRVYAASWSSSDSAGSVARSRTLSRRSSRARTMTARSSGASSSEWGGSNVAIAA